MSDERRPGAGGREETPEGGGGSEAKGSGTDRIFPGERAKAYADAVVAIAMTLLILPLMESAAELGADAEGAGSWFSEHSGQIITFLISFFIIGLFWLGHHRVFSRVVKTSSGLLWLTLLWLLTIVWLPVATALTGRTSHGERTIVLVYIGSMSATAVVWLLIRVYLARHPELHGVPGASSRDGVADALANVILFLIAGVVAALVPNVGYYALILLALAGVAHRALTPLLRRWHPADGVVRAEQ